MAATLRECSFKIYDAMGGSISFKAIVEADFMFLLLSLCAWSFLCQYICIAISKSVFDSKTPDSLFLACFIYFYHSLGSAQGMIKINKTC